MGLFKVEDKLLKQARKQADKVEALREDFQKKSDEELKGLLAHYKERYKNGETLDDLLPEGVIFRTTAYNGKEKEYTSDAGCVDLPMAVLVNADSYSAAEFLAAQLQESAGAAVVGEQTSGKGYSQMLFDLPDGSAMGLSTARYFTGSGKSLIGTGLTPDPQVSLTQAQQRDLLMGKLAHEDDAQLQAAIQTLRQE